MSHNLKTLQEIEDQITVKAAVAARMADPRQVLGYDVVKPMTQEQQLEHYGRLID